MSTSRDDFGIAIRSALLQRGARQKFSLFFLICFSIIIFFFDNYPSKFMDNVRSLLNDGIYRTSSIVTSPFKLVSFFQDGLKKQIFVHSENLALKKELEILRKKDFKLNFLTAENKKLLETIEYAEEQNYSNIVAKVLLDKNSPFLKSIIINKGTRSGIKKGMPVIDKNYLIGRIIETNYLSSRVLLLNDLNSRIPVVIEDTAAQAMIVGTGDNFPKLDYLPERFIAEDGKTVFTSGKDGIFSSGTPIGKIFVKNEQIQVKLFSDPNQLSFVNVVIDDFKLMRGN
jgi:rod shape-determining protein MreC